MFRVEYCESCGAEIPFPVSRNPKFPIYVCADCYGETLALMRKVRRTFPITLADNQYHGGMFNQGEW